MYAKANDAYYIRVKLTDGLSGIDINDTDIETLTDRSDEYFVFYNSMFDLLIQRT